MTEDNPRPFKQPEIIFQPLIIQQAKSNPKCYFHNGIVSVCLLEYSWASVLAFDIIILTRMIWSDVTLRDWNVLSPVAAHVSVPGLFPPLLSPGLELEPGTTQPADIKI